MEFDIQKSLVAVWMLFWFGFLWFVWVFYFLFLTCFEFLSVDYFWALAISKICTTFQIMSMKL